MAEFKSGRGGARKGAGRPKGSTSVKPGERRRRFTVRLPEDLIKWFQSQEQSAGRIIEAAVRDKHNIKGG